MPYKQLTGLKNIQFQEGLPENFGNARGTPSLLILNDLLNQVYSEAVCVSSSRKAFITETCLSFSRRRMFFTRDLSVEIFH